MLVKHSVCELASACDQFAKWRQFSHPKAMPLTLAGSKTAANNRTPPEDFSRNRVLNYDRVCSSALSRLRFLRLRLRAKTDLRRFFWPGFR